LKANKNLKPGNFSGNRTRTYDRTDMSRLLYQLSYAATTPKIQFCSATA
jgi:hypothetical protein